MKPLKRVAITGACGQIAYSLLFRIANGELLGGDQPIALHLLDLPGSEKALEGIKMELEDSFFPLLKEVRLGSDPEKAFEAVHFAFLIGAKPRGPGMERKDLLKENGKIFVTQGKALSLSADKNVSVLVVGNPCNTNCLIAMHHAKNLNRSQFFAMTRLDQNRAVYQLAKKAGVGVEKVRCVSIWGNHSSTQVPDFVHAKIEGQSALARLDRNWLEKTFVPLVQERGAAVIGARGKSSAASAASAALQAMRSILFPNLKDDWFSMAVDTLNNPYGIAKDLVFSFPCTFSEKEGVKIVAGLHLDPFLETGLKLSEKELLEERDLVKDLL